MWSGTTKQAEAEGTVGTERAGAGRQGTGTGAAGTPLPWCTRRDTCPGSLAVCEKAVGLEWK